MGFIEDCFGFTIYLNTMEVTLLAPEDYTYW